MPPASHPWPVGCGPLRGWRPQREANLLRFLDNGPFSREVPFLEKCLEDFSVSSQESLVSDGTVLLGCFELSGNSGTGAKPSPATLWLHSSPICFDFQRIWCPCFAAPPSTSLWSPWLLLAACRSPFTQQLGGREGNPSRYRKGPSLSVCGNLARWLKILIAIPGSQLSLFPSFWI